MKSLKNFSTVVVALAFVFSACEKNVPDQIFDEDAVDMSIKGYAKLDPYVDEGLGTAFTWGAITASDFAKGKTPPFNNWLKALSEKDGGVYVYRTPAKDSRVQWHLNVWQGGADYLNGLSKQTFGNGNDPVWIWFDAAELAELDYKMGDEASITVLVRYRASNNVAFKFNLKTAALWCKYFGPISLDFVWNENAVLYELIKGTKIYQDLGEITQVRVQDAELPPPPRTVCVTVEGLNGIVIEKCHAVEIPGDCVDVPLSDFDEYKAQVQAGLAPNQTVIGWAVKGKKEVWDGKVCDDITIVPIIETCITVTVKADGKVDEIPLCETGYGEIVCPMVDLDLDKYLPIFDDRYYELKYHWTWKNGELFEGTFPFRSCDDLVFVLEYVLLPKITAISWNTGTINPSTAYQKHVNGITIGGIIMDCNESGDANRVTLEDFANRKSTLNKIFTVKAITAFGDRGRDILIGYAEFDGVKWTEYEATIRVENWGGNTQTIGLPITLDLVK